MSRIIIHLHSPDQRYRAKKAIDHADDGMVVEIKKKTRSLGQNARLWAILGVLSEKIEWYGETLTPENWKDILTAAQKREKVVPGIDGGFVVLGQRTSGMTIKEMSELQELAAEFAARHGITRWPWEPPVFPE